MVAGAARTLSAAPFFRDHARKSQENDAPHQDFANYPLLLFSGREECFSITIKRRNDGGTRSRHEKVAGLNVIAIMRSACGPSAF